jgi:hypothetical protein
MMRIISIIKILTVGLILTACESPLGSVATVAPSFQPGLQTADPYLLVYISPVVYSIHSAITPNIPTQSGGTIASYSVTPSLPSGLSLDPATGIISGTPSVILSGTTYTITGTNAAGFVNANLEISVHDTAPAIAYSGSPFTFSAGIAISAQTPTSTGGTITSCSAFPTLPNGLSISSNCVISGTPTTFQASTMYTITANNSGGNGTATISLTVNDTAPILTFSGSPFIFTKNTAISTQNPTNSGGLATSCSTSPALPSGLTLNSNCSISGTPTAIQSATNYTLTGTNTGGSGSTLISIRVNDVVPAISYSGSPFTFSKNVAISAVSVMNSGGTILSCTSSPSLPAGLSLSATCGISGTPTSAQAAANYSISATNTGGTGMVTISIAVNDSLPALSYAGSPLTFSKNTAITTQTPSNSGGTVVSCTSTPALPAGLSLSATCGISGTPSANQAATNYTIHSTNTGGTSAVIISITINDTIPVLTYTGSPFIFSKNSAISVQTPTNSGGTTVSCSANPTLPAGLSISNACVISGTPTVPQASTNYIISAVNTGGTGTVTIAIAINDIAPAISFSGSPFTFGTAAISSQTPTNSGGAITGCASVPTLPVGLSLSSACVISGTPTSAQSSTAYTISATNTGGSGTASIAITINSTPTLTAISMNAGTVGNTITLTGTNFVTGLTIQIGTTNCTTSTFVSSTSATCVVPAASAIATVNVVLTNPSAQSATLTNAFTHLMDAKFWFRGDHASTTGGLVDTWTDLTGNGFSATGTTTTRPTLTASVANLNNLPALTFNGTSSILDQISAANVTKNIAGISWAAALTTADNTAVQQGVWSYSTNTAGSTRFAALMNDTNAGTQICDASGFISTSGRKIDGGATWYMCKANAIPANNAGFIASGDLNFTANTANTIYDGTTVGSSSAATFNGSTLNTSSTASAAAKIGAGSTGARYFKGNIAEMVFYTYHIGATNRQALENYLKTRYGL